MSVLGSSGGEVASGVSQFCLCVCSLPVYLGFPHHSPTAVASSLSFPLRGGDRKTVLLAFSFSFSDPQLIIKCVGKIILFCHCIIKLLVAACSAWA